MESLANEKYVSKQTEAFSVLNMEFHLSFAMEKSLVFLFFFNTLLRGLTIQTTFSNSIAYKVSQANNVNQLQMCSLRSCIAIRAAGWAAGLLLNC